jgi:predicted phosphate transport protein (TIGR00153 family)
MLFNLFRFLMPKDDTFVTAFAAQAAKTVEAAEVFRTMLADPANAAAHHAVLSRIEREADDINRATIRSIHRVFVTPFDRSDILAVTDALDDVIDRMKDGGRRMLLYKVPITPQMLTMGDCILRACERLRDGMPLLGDIAGNAPAIGAMCEAVDAIESEADRALQSGMDALFNGNADGPSPGHKLMVQMVYDGIEAVADRCEDVTDLIQGIVIEQV